MVIIKRIEIMQSEEAEITINGLPLTKAESMTIRVALTSFQVSLNEDGLGEDSHGKKMTELYLKHIENINGCLSKIEPRKDIMVIGGCGDIGAGRTALIKVVENMMDATHMIMDEQNIVELPLVSYKIPERETRSIFRDDNAQRCNYSTKVNK